MDLATSKTDPNFNLLAFVEPAPSITDFEATVVLRCFRSQSDLFDLNLGLRFPGFAFLLCFFVEELPVIEHPAYGRIGVWGDLYKIQIGFLGRFKGLIDWNHTYVFTIRVDETNLFGANFFIYPKV